MPETPVEQRLERRGLEGTGDLSAVLEDIEDEAAEDAGDTFEDQWTVPGPPPTHSPPSTSGQ